jgi:hypothetical protein
MYKGGDALDFKPVIKLFTPDAQCTWLLTELDPVGGLACGLCDLGIGEPELGYISLVELSSLRGKLGLPIKRDRHFVAAKNTSAYADEGRTNGQYRKLTRPPIVRRPLRSTAFHITIAP